MAKIITLQPNIRWEDKDSETGYIWGKRYEKSQILQTLPKVYQDKLGKAGIIAERWMCSDDDRCPSFDEEGRALSELLQKEGEFILGERHIERYGRRIASIMKFLDTSEEEQLGGLSIQVHPREGHPSRPPRPEMWEGPARMFYGFNGHYSYEVILAAAKASTFAPLKAMLNEVELGEGELLHVPGGMVHAVRYDTFVKEWSKAPSKADAKGDLKASTVALSDKTDGKTPRPGKEAPEEALDLIQDGGLLCMIDPEEYKSQPVVLYPQEGIVHKKLFDTTHIQVEKIELSTSYSVVLPTALSLYVESGKVELWKDDIFLGKAEEGEDALIPQGLREVAFVPTSPSATMYVWYAPLDY